METKTMIHKVHFRFMYVVVVTVQCVWYCDQNKHFIRLCQNLVWIKMHKIFIKKVLWCLCLNYNQKCSGGLEGSTQFNWSWLGWVIKVWRVRFENKKQNNYYDIKMIQNEGKHFTCCCFLHIYPLKLQRYIVQMYFLFPLCWCKEKPWY